MLSIQNTEVERLAVEVAELAGETKTGAVRRALTERRARLRRYIRRASRNAGRRERLMRFLDTEVWPRIPEDQLGRAPSKPEREEILGYRPDRVSWTLQEGQVRACTRS